MDLDHASNGIFLRKPNNDVNIKSIHYTSHPKYTKAIERYLDSLDYNESVEVLESQVADLQKQLKRSLENGTPLHNSKGNITGPATYQNKGGGATNEMWDEEIQKTSYNPLKVYDSISEESIDATEESQDYIQKASELVDEMLREQNAQSEQEEYDYYNYYGY